MKFTFTNKEEYLQYRKEWKANYKELSQQIRDYKFARWYQTLGKKRQNRDGDVRLEKIIHKYKTNCFYIHGLKAKATGMLNELTLAKAEANRQYIANKEMITVNI